MLKQLDALRGFAAVYVFLHHAQLMPNSGLGALFYFGQEAVILFFLLSGFVIHYSTRDRGIEIGTYLLHRVRRIYPILLVALAAAYLASSLANRSWVDPLLPTLAGNLAMLQDVASLKRGVWADTYQGNSPLWSLSYEWWFYMLFIPLGLAPLVKKPFAVAVAISVIGFAVYQWKPNAPGLFAGYFLIWWAGVELSKEYTATGTATLRRQMRLLLALAACTLLWALPVALQASRGASLRLGVDPVLQLRHFAAALGMVLAGFAWRRLGLVGFRQVFGIFRRVAPISFSIYALHVPVLVAVGSVLGDLPPVIHAVAAAAVLVPVCYLLEVRLQRRIKAWTDRREAGHLQTPPLAEQLGQ